MGSETMLARFKMVLPAAFGLVLMMSSVGCQTIARDVRVSLAPTLTQGGTPTVTVHIVGVNPSDKESWDSQSMTNYWNGGAKDKFREDKVASGVVKVLQFSDKEGTQQELSSSDPIWKVWDNNGATLLYILSDMPRTAQDKPGNTDPRRRIFPLNRVTNPPSIWIEVDRNGIITKKS
jgi:hypothetical protein